MHACDTNTYGCDSIVCVFEPVRPHSSAESIDVSFIPIDATNMVTLFVFPTNSADDIIYDDQGIYITIRCKPDCSVKVWVTGTLCSNSRHWVLRYNDIIVIELQNLVNDNQKSQGNAALRNVNNSFTCFTFYSKESSVCREHVFNNFFFYNWTQ